MIVHFWDDGGKRRTACDKRVERRRVVMVERHVTCVECLEVLRARRLRVPVIVEGPMRFEVRRVTDIGRPGTGGGGRAPVVFASVFALSEFIKAGESTPIADNGRRMGWPTVFVDVATLRELVALSGVERLIMSPADMPATYPPGARSGEYPLLMVYDDYIE